MSNSVLSHRQQPTRLPRPWDSPGKNTGVGCHFHLQFMKVKSESEVTQSCPTLHDLMDCSLPGSSIHGIFQARVLERGAIAFSTSQVVQWKKKNLSAIAGDMSSTPGSGWSLGGGNGNPLQYSCLENPMHKRIIWWVTVDGVAESQTRPSHWPCTTIVRDHMGTEIVPRARAEVLKLKEYLVEYHKSPHLRSRKNKPVTSHCFDPT